MGVQIPAPPLAPQLDRRRRPNPITLPLQNEARLLGRGSRERRRPPLPPLLALCGGGRHLRSEATENRRTFEKSFLEFAKVHRVVRAQLFRSGSFSRVLSSLGKSLAHSGDRRHLCFPFPFVVRLSSPISRKAERESRLHNGPPPTSCLLWIKVLEWG